MTKQHYAGIDQDENGGLTHLGRVVRDAWVFGILPESETCAGWDGSQMQNLYEQVYAAWGPTHTYLADYQMIFNRSMRHSMLRLW